MATIVFGGGVTEMRGSIAGNVFSRNANGAYSRARTAPVNPATTPQAFVRDAFSGSAQNWRDLTDAQRQAWIDAAEGVQGSYTNRAGQPSQYTGQQLYMKVQQLHNAWVLGGGSNGAGADNPPPLTPAPPTVEVSALTVEVDGTNTLTAMDITVEAAAGTNQVMVYASPPVSAGIMRPASVRFTLVASLENVTAVSGIDLLTAYTALFGDTANPGDKIFVQVKRISTTSWRESSPVTLSDVIEVGP